MSVKGRGKPLQRVQSAARPHLLTMRLSKDEHALAVTVAAERGMCIAALFRILVADEARRLLGLEKRGGSEVTYGHTLRNP